MGIPTRLATGVDHFLERVDARLQGLCALQIAITDRLKTTGLAEGDVVGRTGRGGGAVLWCADPTGAD